MTAAAPTKNAGGFALWRRASGTRPWVKVATAATRVELLGAMKGTADYMLLPLTDSRPTAPGGSRLLAPRG